MEIMNTGDAAPNFTLKDGEGNSWTLSDHSDKIVVLLFYPGDNTPKSSVFRPTRSNRTKDLPRNISFRFDCCQMLTAGFLKCTT